MSKSLGNFFTVRDLLDQGVPGEVIRFVLLSTHYSKPMDWTAEKVVQAHEALMGFLEITRGVDAVAPDDEVVNALADDLNISLAISRLHVLKKDGHGAKLLASARLMGLLDFHPTAATFGWGEISESVSAQLVALARRWATLRANRDFDAADELKTRAQAAGVSLRATKQAVGQGSVAERASNFNPSKLDSLK